MCVLKRGITPGPPASALRHPPTNRQQVLKHLLVNVRSNVVHNSPRWVRPQGPTAACPSAQWNVTQPSTAMTPRYMLQFGGCVGTFCEAKGARHEITDCVVTSWRHRTGRSRREKAGWGLAGAVGRPWRMTDGLGVSFWAAARGAGARNEPSHTLQAADCGLRGFHWHTAKPLPVCHPWGPGRGLRMTKEPAVAATLPFLVLQPGCSALWPPLPTPRGRTAGSAAPRGAAPERVIRKCHASLVALSPLVQSGAHEAHGRAGGPGGAGWAGALRQPRRDSLLARGWRPTGPG